MKKRKGKDVLRTFKGIMQWVIIDLFLVLMQASFEI